MFVRDLTESAPSQMSGKTATDFWSYITVFVIMCVIVSQAFGNFLPSLIGSILEGTLVILYSLAMIALITKAAHRNYAALFLICYLLIAIILGFGALQTGNLLVMSRYFVGLAALSVVFRPDLIALSNRQVNLVRTVLWVCATFAASYAFLGPRITVGAVRLAVFTGGADGLHPSAYALLGMFFVLLSLGHPKTVVGRGVNLAILLLLASAILGFEVRTVYLVAGVVAFMWWLQKRRIWRNGLTRALIFTIMIMISMFTVLLLSTVEDQLLASFSSGRTQNYIERLDIIWGRDLPEFLFGTGPGSDRFRGSVFWSHEEKDSHNDILTATIEMGFVGMIAFISIPLIVLNHLRGPSLAILLGVLASSLVSNGILLRPPLAAFYIFAMAQFSLLERRV